MLFALLTLAGIELFAQGTPSYSQKEISYDRREVTSPHSPLNMLRPKKQMAGASSFLYAKTTKTYKNPKQSMKIDLIHKMHSSVPVYRELDLR